MAATTTAAATAAASAPEEQYELQEYNSQLAPRRADDNDQEKEDKEARRQAKRAEKRRWLEDRDEMKFSHSIQFNAVPDWSSHYIAYSNLKKVSVYKSCNLSSSLSLSAN